MVTDPKNEDHGPAGSKACWDAGMSCANAPGRRTTKAAVAAIASPTATRVSISSGNTLRGVLRKITPRMPPIAPTANPAAASTNVRAATVPVLLNPAPEYEDEIGQKFGTASPRQET